jgi:hypothetical protein
MKKFTCRELGGPCDMEFEGETMDEVIGMGAKHIMTTTDEAHEPMKSQMTSGTEKGKEEWFAWFKGLWDAKANNNSEKGFAFPMIVGIIALVVIIVGGGYFYIQNQSKVQEQQKVMMEKEAMEKEAGEMMKKGGGEIMKKENGEMMTNYTGAVLAGKSSPLLDFTKADYDSAVASDKLVVLYFYANWCPICKAEFPLMQGAFNEIINDKVVGFRVNYKDNQTDSDEKALAVQYGIPYQHLAS